MSPKQERGLVAALMVAVVLAVVALVLWAVHLVNGPHSDRDVEAPGDDLGHLSTNIAATSPLGGR